MRVPPALVQRADLRVGNQLAEARHHAAAALELCCKGREAQQEDDRCHLAVDVDLFPVTQPAPCACNAQTSAASLCPRAPAMA